MKNNLVTCSTYCLIIALTLAPTLPAAAQEDQAPADAEAATGGQFPEGWEARVDRDQPVGDVSFTTMGEGFHATTGPAAVFYNSDWDRAGDYEFAARFTQTTAPEHPEAYGIVIGGSDLSGPDQTYSYFLVRKTGEYFIANRTGDDRTVVADWTAHDAIEKEDESGKQTNVLGARVEGDEVIFTANGVEVDRRPRSEVHADGLAGYRINHRLDVHIDPIMDEGTN